MDFGVTGSVLNGGGSWPFEDANTSDWADMIDGYQNAALASRLGIPIIYGIDAVHGNNNVYGATIFPHNIGLGATRFFFPPITIIRFHFEQTTKLGRRVRDNTIGVYLYVFVRLEM